MGLGHGHGHGLMDPAGSSSCKWIALFTVACMLSLFIDPLFLMVSEVKPEFCIADISVVIHNLIAIRSITDVFYLINVFVTFKTAYVEPSSRVFGRGVLVLDHWKIAFRYFKFRFWIDIAAALPLPQVYYLVIIPSIRGMMISDYRTSLRFIPVAQYLLRLVLAYPLFMKIVAATGIVSRTALFGVAYNMIFILLASNVAGCCWYLQAVQRQLSCWRSLCSPESSICNYEFFVCGMIHNPQRNGWLQSSNITQLCIPDANYYQFGIYAAGISIGVTSATFFQKFFYSVQWGLLTLCALGQNMITSIDIGENWFAMLLIILGLMNYALLLGNVQGYLQSVSARLDNYIIEKNDREHWMHHRQLPPKLRERIRKYDRYRWVATQGTDEQALLRGLPPDLRRQIKRYVCLELVRRVPLFTKMDERLLDAICERLNPTLYTEGTLIISEGDPVTEMLFIVRGQLKSYTTGDFFTSFEVGPGEFSGEELLAWALDPPLNGTCPSSIFTLKAITDVEAFALDANDLKFSALQFKQMHSQELKHTLRFYSHQWRTWAACYIQAAWRRHKKRKLLAELTARESDQESIDTGATLYEEMEVFVPRPGAGMAVYAARIMADIRKGSSNRFGPDSCSLRSLFQ